MPVIGTSNKIMGRNTLEKGLQARSPFLMSWRERFISKIPVYYRAKKEMKREKVTIHLYTQKNLNLFNFQYMIKTYQRSKINIGYL